MQSRILLLEMSSKQPDNFAAEIPIPKSESVPNPRVNQSNTDNILSQRNAFSDSNIRRAVVPNLSSKLNDGKNVSPDLWKLKILDKLEMYADDFLSDRHRKNYLIDQTEGIARKYLEPLILSNNLDQGVYDLVDDVVTFLTDPAEADNARNNYLNLAMKPNQTIWDFYRQFRILASTAGITQDLVLRSDL
ncbi:putative simnilar to protein from sclerotinia sclerotiorum [Erysiphe neolycopersici]|uniref:Putative simnilar to protein from sclerotinia sclerotiorum n=1 Tax=Erysiphe neolycopersici TaxID=212602 RepID=A0A420HBV2_9PEZI|nr:putative simnilar to protein from sclerotinia sclerotiorum [Erysiphe neolycopersici]